jgi:two-component system phosphate regulon response regulator PhoB
MRKKITLVEDDADASLIIHKVLSDAGYDVATFSEGTPLVENNFPVPDMFILDNFMPTIHGIALCKFLKLKADTKSIPILIISANQQLKDKAKDAGAAFFLGKPFHSQELLEFVTAALGKKIEK